MQAKTDLDVLENLGKLWNAKNEYEKSYHVRAMLDDDFSTVGSSDSETEANAILDGFKEIYPQFEYALVNMSEE